MLVVFFSIKIFQSLFCIRSDRKYNVYVYANTKNKGDENQTEIIRVDARSPRIISFSQVIVASNLNSIVLDCDTIPGNAVRKWRHLTVHGFPKIMYIDDHILSPYAFTLDKDSEGTYQCYIPENKEMIEYKVSLKPFNKEVPRKPTVDFFEATTNNISLSWISAGTLMKDDPIRTFVVKITSLADNSTIEYEIPGSLRSFVVPNLDCGSSFKLEFFARNQAGNSSHDIIFVRTRGTKPDIPNTAGIFISKHPKSMCFKLAEFRPGQGCHANSFKITIQPTNQGSEERPKGIIEKSVSRNELGNQSCFNVTDLHPDTDYNYIIEAFNKNGSSKANGHFKTLRLISVSTPTSSTTNTEGPGGFSIAWILIPVLIIGCIVVSLGIWFYIIRKNTTNSMQSLSPINNQLSNKPPVPQIQRTPIPSMHQNRRLPTPPNSNNVYDKGISEKHEEDEDDEMLKPYATYESVTKQAPMTSRNLQGRPLASYNMGSQAHSYQYPEIIDNQQPIRLVDPPNLKLMAYEHDLKQPLLSQSLKSSNRQYDKGYSIGESRPPSTLRPQNVRSDPHQNIDLTSRKGRVLPMVSVASHLESEAYRPGSSMCSSTTESSTKEELSQVFRNTTFGNKFTTHLVEQDEDRDSTARGNRSTLLNRSLNINHTLSDDSTQPESYCESGSSGDDIGIRNFTQDPPGQILAPPGCRQFHPTHTVSSTYDSVDRTPALNSFNFPHRPGILPEEDEEKDDNNYTNNFVVV